MSVETVKVYKGKDDVTCNKSDVKVWNDAGYFTSSQQKERAAAKKKLTPAQLKEAEDEKKALEKEEAINALIIEGLAKRKEAGEKDLTEEELVSFKTAAAEEYSKSQQV